MLPVMYRLSYKTKEGRGPTCFRTETTFFIIEERSNFGEGLLVDLEHLVLKKKSPDFTSPEVGLSAI